jgi:hypothetical protein
MNKQEQARLDALAKALVAGLPVETAVTYFPDTDRLFVDSRSLAHSNGLEPLEVGSYTVVSEHPDIEQFVRQEIANFLSKRVRESA